jgi:drug/metabolite transporter (DMT)-like permease
MSVSVRSAPIEPQVQVAPQGASLASGKRYSRADALAILAVLFWGLNVTFTKGVLNELDALAFVTVRMIISTTLALGAIAILERSIHVKMRDLVPLGMLGLLGIGLAQLIFILGLNLSLASHGALLLGLNPVFAALLAGWLGWDRLRAKNWIGVGVCLVGVWLLTGAGLVAMDGNILLGDAIVLFSAVLGAMYTVLSRRFLFAYSPLKILTYGMLFSLVPMLLLGATSIGAQDWSGVSVNAWAALLFSAVFGTVLASIFWLKSVTRIGIVRTSIYQYLLPIFGIVTALFLLHEAWDPIQWVGAVIVLVGMMYARLA